MTGLKKNGNPGRRSWHPRSPGCTAAERSRAVPRHTCVADARQCSSKRFRPVPATESPVAHRAWRGLPDHKTSRPAHTCEDEGAEPSRAAVSRAHRLERRSGAVGAATRSRTAATEPAACSRNHPTHAGPRARPLRPPVGAPDQQHLRLAHSRLRVRRRRTYPDISTRILPPVHPSCPCAGLPCAAVYCRGSATRAVKFVLRDTSSILPITGKIEEDEKRKESGR